MYTIPEPRIDRTVTLHMGGDWGQANLHRTFSFLAQELWDRTGPGSRFAIWSARGMGDTPRLVARREVDVALSVPVAMVPAALRGTDQYEGEPMPDLRALAVIPQDDRILVAARASLGLRSFADLHEKKPALRIACSLDDGINTVGWATSRLLEAVGLSRETLRGWGCTFLEYERPDDTVDAMLAGEADLLIEEAVMAPWWHALADREDLAFFQVPQGALDTLRERHGWPAGTMAAGRLRGMHEPVTTLDFSDFLMVCRADLPDDLAYLITWILCERHEVLDRTYSHRPPERSGITWPLDPRAMQRTSIPLHPGARACYEAWNQANGASR